MAVLNLHHLTGLGPHPRLRGSLNAAAKSRHPRHRTNVKLKAPRSTPSAVSSGPEASSPRLAALT
jgi:hypothetical protein